MIQKEIRTAPERHLHHQIDQLVQLTLQFLDNGQVVCMLGVHSLQLHQTVLQGVIQTAGAL